MTAEELAPLAHDLFQERYGQVPNLDSRTDRNIMAACVVEVAEGLMRERGEQGTVRAFWGVRNGRAGLGLRVIRRKQA